MSKRGDREFILDMLSACERILEYTENLSYEDFCSKQMVVDAVVRNIEILGEATKNVSDELKNKHPEIEWQEIVRTRDKIIHFYFGVNLSIIWDIIKNDIPNLYEEIEKIMETHEKEGEEEQEDMEIEM